MNIKKYIKIQLFFVLLFAIFSSVLFFPSHKATAISGGGVGGYPAYPDPSIKYSQSWFIYTINPGETKDDEILIVNSTDETQIVKLYAVDSVPNNRGNFALEAEDASRDDIGAWIVLSKNFVELEPNTSIKVPFTITIPKNADVGEHSGGIIIQKAQKSDLNKVSGASIQTRVGVRVYETVPGEIIRNVKILDFAVKPTVDKNNVQNYSITLDVLNESNISLQARTDLKISGWGKIKYFTRSKFSGGVVIDLADITDFFKGEVLSRDWQLLRDQKVSTSWEWPRPRFGRYTFHVTIQYGDEPNVKTTETKSITVTIVPWKELAVLFTILLLALLFIVYKKLAFRRGKWVKYKVKQGDQLALIAKKTGIHWKKITKANHLKDPYIKPGETILVPEKWVSDDNKKNALKKADGAKTEDKGDKTKNLKIKKPLIPRVAYYAIGVGIAIIITLVIIVAGIMKNNKVATPLNTALAPVEKANEVILKPSDISVGVYDPNELAGEATKLLITRLKDIGFIAEIQKDIVDPAIAEQDLATVAYKGSNEGAVEVLAKNIFATKSYRKGQNQYIASDIVVGSWDMEDIQWGDQKDAAEKILHPNPKDVPILIQNASTVNGAAKKLSNFLVKEGYVKNSMENAQELTESPTIIYYAREYKAVARDLMSLLADMPEYGGISVKQKSGQNIGIQIIIGPVQTPASDTSATSTAAASF